MRKEERSRKLTVAHESIICCTSNRAAQKPPCCSTCTPKVLHAETRNSMSLPTSHQSKYNIGPESAQELRRQDQQCGLLVQPQYKHRCTSYICVKNNKSSETQKARTEKRPRVFCMCMYHLDNPSGIPRAQKLHEAEAAAPFFRHRFLRVRALYPLLRNHPHRRDVHLFRENRPVLIF